MTHFLGWYLLESTLFAIAVGFLVLYSRKRSAAARHTMLLIAAAKFLVPAALFSVIGAYLHSRFPSPHSLLSISQNLSKLLPSESAPARAVEAPTGFWMVFGLVWLGGSLLALAMWIRRLLASFESSPQVLDSDKESLLRMQQRIGYHRAIGLRSSDAQMEPVLAGIWRPTIIFPKALSKSLSQAELDAVVLHELAHAKRWDNLSGAFVHALVCVFWFHPLLWWMERRLIAERELACDELVVRSGIPPEIYAAGIWKVCGLRFSVAVAGISGVTSSHLQERLEEMMSYTLRRPVPHVPKLLMAVLIAAITIVPFTVGFLKIPGAYGQAKQTAAQPGPDNSRSPMTCVSADKEYPEGAVIQVGNGPEQMCASRVIFDPADPNHSKRIPEWIRTNKAIRERSNSVVHLPEAPPYTCKPKSTASGRNCSCEGAELGFSPGATVNSANGSLTCEKGNWRPTKPGELGPPN
jgi:beta-lactamase regulating signal transducer with metallopeptidase domain